MMGWDVYALQTMLPVGRDGRFGPLTHEATKKLQQQLGLKDVDGIAGILTQRSGCLAVIERHNDQQDYPEGLIKGMVEGETSFQIGSHTATYPTGRRDVGVVQQHIDPTAENLAVAFDVPKAIARLCADPDRGMRVRKNRYLTRIKRLSPTQLSQLKSVTGCRTLDHLAWWLAVASWNAPAWADKLAAGGALGTLGMAHITKYVSSKVVYVEEWTP